MILAQDAAAAARVTRPGGRTASVRERILQAAAEMVARHGINGLRYEDVAELAGVNKTSVYRNWPDRGKLIGDALFSHAEEVAPMPDSGDLRADLVEFLMTLAATLSTPRGRALTQAVMADLDDADVRATVRETFERRLSVVRQRVDTAVGRAELPPVDVYFFAEMLSAPVHLYVNRGQRAFTLADAERITDVVLAGIRALRP